MKRLVFILIAAFISTANIWAQQSQDMPEYDPNSPVTDLGDVILDYNLFKEWPKERVTSEYDHLCSEYPNTLYYARNYTDDWHEWQSNGVREANKRLVKRHH
jgi:hypothetical protein